MVCKQLKYKLNLQNLHCKLFRGHICYKYYNVTKQQKIILFILASINFTHILDFMIMMPLSNYLMPAFKISPEKFSYIVASYSISACCSGLIAMFFVDRFDRKKVVVFAYTGFLIGTLCCGISPHYYTLMASRIVAGLFGGILGAQVLSIVSDAFNYENRGKAMGFLFSAFSFASVIGVPLALFLAQHLGWHTPFFLIVGLGALILFSIIKYLPNFTTHLVDKSVRATPKEIINNIILKRLNLTAFSLSATLMLGHFVIIPFLNPYMEHNVGFTDWQRNLIYIIGGLLTIFSAPMAGKLADKFGKHTVFATFAALSLIPIYLVTNLTFMPYYYALIITGIWFILSSSRNIPAQALVSNIVPPHQRGSFQSFNSCVTSMFVGLASLIAGKIVTQDATGKLHHYNIAGYLSIAIVIVAIIISRFIPQQEVVKK
jgi:MFS transporter, DHA1 family, inner membrane transport protein